MVTDINQLDLNKRYTYADYLNWQFEEVVELIKGKIFRMSPAPNRNHQTCSSNLHVIIGSYLRKKRCKIYSAPFDVRLPLPADQQSHDKIDTVVQPDISVICDLTKLDYRGCNGAPDWIIEILSQSTAQKDLNEKFDLYQNAGVKEYWIVHPEEGTILVYLLDQEGQYQLLRQRPFFTGEKIPSGVLPGFEVPVGEVFN
jgi:Uma2 family endonuclease